MERLQTKIKNLFVRFPSMPWFNLRDLSDTELKAMWAYVRSIPPVKNAVPLRLLPSGAEKSAAR